MERSRRRLAAGCLQAVVEILVRPGGLTLYEADRDATGWRLKHTVAVPAGHCSDSATTSPISTNFFVSERVGWLRRRVVQGMKGSCQSRSELGGIRDRRRTGGVHLVEEWERPAARSRLRPAVGIRGARGNVALLLRPARLCRE